VTTVPFGAEPVDTRTAPERWRAVPIGWRLLLVALAVVAAFELGSSLVTGIAGNSPAGDQTSSSFSTSPSGVGAMAELLAARGHHVAQDTAPLPGQNLTADTVLFVIDPTSWTGTDNAAVARLVTGGGRAVIVGRPPSGLAGLLFGTAGVPRWEARPSGVAEAATQSSLTAGLASVSSGPTGSFEPGAASVVLAGPHGDLAISSGHESGGTATAVAPAVVMVASSTPFTNAALSERDNAAFAINLAGPGPRPVVFDEYDHGYGRTGTGLAGLPSWWRWGLGIALLAVVVWMLSASRRFGPVESSGRPLIPPRVAYVDAMATGLGSVSGDRLATTLTPLRQEGRRLLCRRAGIRVDAPDDEVAEAARQAMLPDEVIEGVLAVPQSASGALECGRALAWLEFRRGGSA
jgi:hypothetical protein